MCGSNTLRGRRFGASSTSCHGGNKGASEVRQPNTTQNMRSRLLSGSSSSSSTSTSTSSR